MFLNQLIKGLSLLFLIMMSDGCKNEGVKEDIKNQGSEVVDELWSVKSINGTKVIEVNEISVLQKALDERIEVKLKRLPNFDFEITVKENTTFNVWLYSTNGYVMSKDDEENKIFKVKLKLLNKMLL